MTSLGKHPRGTLENAPTIGNVYQLNSGGPPMVCTSYDILASCAEYTWMDLDNRIQEVRLPWECVKEYQNGR